MTPPTEKVIIFLVHKTWFPKSDRKTAKDARKLKKKNTSKETHCRSKITISLTT